MNKYPIEYCHFNTTTSTLLPVSQWPAILSREVSLFNNFTSFRSPLVNTFRTTYPLRFIIVSRTRPTRLWQWTAWTSTWRPELVRWPTPDSPKWPGSYRAATPPTVYPTFKYSSMDSHRNVREPGYSSSVWTVPWRFARTGERSWWDPPRSL